MAKFQTIAVIVCLLLTYIQLTMKQYESSAKCFTVGLVGALITLLLIIGLNTCAQSIGIGIGYTSSGDVPVTLTVSGKKLGYYITYLAETHDITPDYIGVWNNETTLGISYKIMSNYPQISLLAGTGWNNTIEFKRRSNALNTSYSVEETGFSYEVGADIQPFEQCKFLYIKVLISNYTGFKSMVCLRHFF